jgi:hypothetical protein
MPCRRRCAVVGGRGYVRLARSFIPQAFGGTTPDSIKWRAANGTVITTIRPSS